MPTVYFFRSINQASEAGTGRSGNEFTRESTSADQKYIRAELEAAAAVLAFLAPLFRSEHAQVIVEHLANFFFATYENAIHFASRHHAWRDQATFDEIERLVLPLQAAAQGLERNEWIKEERMRKSVATAMDKVLKELEAVIEGRAMLVPGVLP